MEGQASMSEPFSANALMDAIKSGGAKCVGVRSWKTHNRTKATGKTFGGVNGIMVHHTVTKGKQATIDICYNGHASLPGPLCHGVISKDGSVNLVSAGYANHAGLGDDDVFRAVVAEKPIPTDNEANTDGNKHFYGFECENLGDGKDPWPAVQLTGIINACAGICVKKGWSEKSVIGHLEWQPGKIDPRGFSMDWLRDEIRIRIAELKGENKPPASTKKYHVVVKGETMYGIAKKFDTTVAKLLVLNRNIVDSDEIIPGQKIRVK